MGSSTFSGPIKSGTVREGSGQNTGSPVLAQSATWVQSTTAADTGITIPANSQIIDVAVYVTTACDGASQNLSVGTTATSTELFSALALGVSADTIFFGSAGTVTDADTWESIGSSDLPIYVIFSAGSAGAGTITVQYVQN
jgi:hypothetical protein